MVGCVAMVWLAQATVLCGECGGDDSEPGGCEEA